MNLFDPRTKEFIAEVGEKDFKSRTKAFVIDLVRERVAAKKKHPYQICVISVKDRTHRWFNFDPVFIGRLNHSDYLHSPAWRLATDEEEEAAYKHDQEEQRLAYLNSPEGVQALHKSVGVAAMDKIAGSDLVNEKKIELLEKHEEVVDGAKSPGKPLKAALDKPTK